MDIPFIFVQCYYMLFFHVIKNKTNALCPSESTTIPVSLVKSRASFLIFHFFIPSGAGLRFLTTPCRHASRNLAQRAYVFGHQAAQNGPSLFPLDHQLNFPLYLKHCPGISRSLPLPNPNGSPISGLPASTKDPLTNSSPS